MKSGIGLFSIDDAARILGVSQRTVYRLIDDDKLEKVQIGTRIVRIPAASLLKLIEGGGVKG